MNDPGPKTIPCIVLLFGLSYILLSPFFFLGALAFDGAFLLLNRRFRNWLRHGVPLLFVWFALLGLVTFARYAGGGYDPRVLEDAPKAIKLISMAFITIGVFYLYVKPRDYLLGFDMLRLPRGLSYLLLSTGTLLGFVRSVGAKQHYLLTLKEPGARTLSAKAKAYYRIVAPTFTLCLSRQLIHAKSLHSRSFFSVAGHRVQRADISWKLQDFVLIGLFLTSLLSWWSIQRWAL